MASKPSRPLHSILFELATALAQPAFQEWFTRVVLSRANRPAPARPAVTPPKNPATVASGGGGSDRPTSKSTFVAPPDVMDLYDHLRPRPIPRLLTEAEMKNLEEEKKKAELARRQEHPAILQSRLANIAAAGDNALATGMVIARERERQEGLEAIEADLQRADAATAKPLTGLEDFEADLRKADEYAARQTGVAAFEASLHRAEAAPPLTGLEAFEADLRRADAYAARKAADPFEQFLADARVEYPDGDAARERSRTRPIQGRSFGLDM